MDRSSDARINKLIEGIQSYLEIPSIEDQSQKDFSSWVSLLKIDQQVLENIGLDMAVFLGSSGDWLTAHSLTQLLLEQVNTTEDLRLWKLRCLWELEKSAELLAYVGSQVWPDSSLVAVNYLAGRAHEALGMFEEAQNRYLAVHKVDPTYRDVFQRVKSSSI